MGRKLMILSASFVVALLFSYAFIGTLATYSVGNLVKLKEENNEQHIGIIQKLITDSSDIDKYQMEFFIVQLQKSSYNFTPNLLTCAVTACEIRMTDGSLETVTKNINDPALTSYAPENP